MRCNRIVLLRGSEPAVMGATRIGREGAMPMPVSAGAVAMRAAANGQPV
jgi:hypothetical protein